MPHTVDGFMKKAQREKFVRNRDVKLKEKEIQKEEKIQKGMSEGVCPQCRDKAQWRFQYGKYKPLKKIAGCTGCHQKCVTKAYRALCDKCATTRKVCPGCCGDISEQHMKRKERNDFLGVDPDEVVVVNRATAPAMYTGQDEEDSEEDDDEDEDDQEEEDGEDDNEDKDDMEQEESDISNKKSTSKPDEDSVSVSAASSTSAADTHGIVAWNAERFEKIASSKYSKSRVVGAPDDSSVGVFEFANGKTTTEPEVFENMDSTLS